MIRYLRRMTSAVFCFAAICCILFLHANAAYPTMPTNWQDVRVTVGGITMPLDLYPSGTYFDPEKRTMSVAEQALYGLNVGSDIDLRGWECVGFARFVYTALYYKYPQDATIDTTLAYSHGTSYAYRNMIYEIFGSRTLPAGTYTASTVKTLFTSCSPGAVARVTGHSFVIMAIYDDGILIYDANYASSNTVSVRPYTWQSFVNTFGDRAIEAVQMPAYYPGYTYSMAGQSGSYPVDTAAAGQYTVTASALNVRSKPSTSSVIMGILSPGTLVDVTGTYDGWGQIQYSGNVCWVSMDYLAAYTPDTNPGSSGSDTPAEGSGSSGGESASADVMVTFDTNGGLAEYTCKAYTAGQRFANLPAATKTGRTLCGWTDGKTYYTENSIVPDTDQLTLKASWCIQSYQDVLEDDWFASSVESAYNYGLISADTAFNPLDSTTRAQLVTVLAREYMRETGDVIPNNHIQVFFDVEENLYYSPYVAWGNAAGIVQGTGDGMFSPDDFVTREQIAVFLYRLGVYTGRVSRSGTDTGVLNRFRDSASVSGYAREAMSWAVSAGILQGDDLGCVNPRNSARRSEMTAMFVRYISYIN